MSKVLLLSSFSEASAKAVQYTVSNLSDSTREVHLAHIFQVNQPDGILISIDDIMENALHSKFRIELKETADVFIKKGLPTKIHVLKGTLREMLDMLVLQVNAHLLILGSSGHLQTENFQVNGYHIGRNTETPCLIIPKSANTSPPLHMLLFLKRTDQMVDFHHKTLHSLTKSVQSVQIVSVEDIDQEKYINQLFTSSKNVIIGHQKIKDEKELPKLIDSHNSDLLLWNGPLKNRSSLKTIDQISARKRGIPIWVAH